MAQEQLSQVTASGYSALHLAASNLSGNGELSASACKALLSAGANLEARTGDEGVVDGLHCAGLTPLLVAARAGCADVARLLLSSGASTSATDEHYEGTALHWAAYHGHSRCAPLSRGSLVPLTRLPPSRAAGAVSCCSTPACRVPHRRRTAAQHCTTLQGEA